MSFFAKFIEVRKRKKLIQIFQVKLYLYQLKWAMNHSNVRKRIEIEWVYFPMHVHDFAFSFRHNVTTTKNSSKEFQSHSII